MTVEFHELWTSRAADGKSVTVKFLAMGEESTFPIREAVFADFTTFPEVNGAFYRNDEQLSIDQVDGLLDHFIVSVTWEAPTRKSEKEKRQAREPGDSHWKLATTTQPVRIANAKATQIKTTAGGAFATTTDTAIGYSSATNEVEGTDVLASETRLELSFYKPAALVTDAFRTTVENLTNPPKTNDDVFLGYAVGELLIVEATFSSDAANFTNVRCDYAFLVDRERTETLEVLGDVTIPPHYQLDIQWELFKDEALTPPRERRRPKSVKKHRVYDGGTFAPLTATS